MSDIRELSELMQQGRAKNVKLLTSQLLEEGISPKDILEKAFLSGMGVVGEKFKNNEIFVPEVLIAARAMNAGMEVLKPYLISENVEPVGTVVLGTVKGDLHDIGKNLVGMMMKGKGFNVIDLGTDVSPETFIKAAQDYDAKIIACSALLTTTMRGMADVVNALSGSNLKDKVKVMIGGAPVSESFCREIGADSYTPDAATAADVAYTLCTN